MPDVTDEELRQQVEQHTPLVEMIARNVARRLPASVDCDDLIQDGQVALINAILSSSKKITAAHFKNYLAMRVKGAMLDGLRVLDHGSRQLRKDMRGVELAIQKLGHRFGRMPFEKEVAAELGLPLKTYQRMLQEAADYSLISLEDIVEPDVQLQVPSHSRDSDPLGVLERAAFRQSLAEALQGLSKQCSSVMQCYYVQDMKMHQIGKKLKVSEARVSQIHAQAIAELRAIMVDGSGAMPALKPRRSTRAQAGAVPDQTPAG